MIDVGLDDGDEVGFVDLEDAVHPLERDHDPASCGTAPPVYPVPPPRGTIGMRCSAHRRHNRRDLAVVPREHDDVGRMAALERVGAVDRARLLVGADVLRPEGRLELGEDAW